MDKVTFQDFSVAGGDTATYAIIEHSDGSFTSMPKAVYDEQQVEQATLVTESAPTA